MPCLRHYLWIVEIEALATGESVGVPPAASGVDDLFERAVHGLLHRLRPEDVGGVLQEFVVDVDQPLAHEVQYIFH